MSFFDRFRSPDSREQRARERAEREAEQLRLAEAQRQQGQADEEARIRQVFIDAVGPDLAEADVDTPEQAILAIKLARLRKKELQAEKRQLADELADVREGWRERQAGRYSTVALGRGTSARILRAGIQSKRRAERQDHAETVNAYSDARQEIERKLLVVERLIVELERMSLGMRADP